jgi:putative nucleotidyltransferase with HDIG domain
MSDPHATSPYENLARRFAAAVRGLHLYAADHPLQHQHLVQLADTLAVIHTTRPSIALGVVGGQLVVADTPLARSTGALAELLGRLTSSGIERITVDAGVTDTELATFVTWVAGLTQQQSSEPAPPPTLAHITVGRIGAEPERERERSGIAQDMAALKRLYDEASTSAEGIFESALTEGRPELSLARGAVEGLAESIAQNRTALIALTAMKGYDNYTFTHMVNVSILAMAQAEALGIEGQTLREFGMSALMHDIGKVRTPSEILQKSGPLTEEEFVVMKRHVVDGAEILRQTPEMPIMAPTVAFEHHLRVDGTGYPSVRRPSLNLATMLTGIADVYDAMRSQRAYQQAFPSDRILAVMKRNDGTQFDQNLVRRFVQLIGIYPPGTLVRLSTNEIAVVLQIHAPDPHRPRVRILQDNQGRRVPSEPIRHLWETSEGAEDDVHVSAPLDAAAYGLDPLEYL